MMKLRYSTSNAWKSILVLGENHPQTLNAMHNLAITYESQGKYYEAEVLLKQCLDRRKAVLGENHPETLSTMNNLADVYESQGKYNLFISP